jgi:hypothetical protein
MVSEISEMLTACGTWQTHRRRYPAPVNHENIRRQLIDQFKYWMSIAQVWGFTDDEMSQTYWRKSAVVRQRHSEEFLVNLDRPVMILDLDNVLCDYTAGFSHWVLTNLTRMGIHFRDAATAAVLPLSKVVERLQILRDERAFYSAASMKVYTEDWMKVQHLFRAQGGFRNLPAMPGLDEFIVWARGTGYAIVGMTSRSIEWYPNIYDDTLEWLALNGLPMDCVWWGTNKAEKVAGMMPKIADVAFVVDDDPRYLKQYADLGVKTIYWMQQGYGDASDMQGLKVIPVQTLMDIVQLESANTTTV